MSDGTPVTPVPESTTPEGGTTPEPEKLLTQADVDRIVKERLARQKSQFGDYDDLKAKAEEYDRIKTEQLSEVEKATQKASGLEKALQAKDAELAAIKRNQTASEVALKVAKESGVSPDAALKLAGKLDGEDAEAMEASAKELFSYLAKSAPASPPPAADDISSAKDPEVLAFEKSLGLT